MHKCYIAQILLKMHKILSALLVVGFIASSIKADATFQQANQPPQVVNDTPQTAASAYVPAAATYQNADTISVCARKFAVYNFSVDK